MSKETRKAMENELDLLTGKPYSFDIQYDIYVPKCKFLPFLGQKKETIRKTMKMYPPTLAILDLMSSNMIEIDLEELRATEDKNNVKSMIAARQIVKKHSWRMANIIAIAVLGENAFKVKKLADGRIERKMDKDAIVQLTTELHICLRPQELLQLVRVVTSQSDIASFIVSTTLMTGVNTATPMTNRAVEQQD